GTEGWMEIPVAVWPDPRLETVIRLRGREDMSDEAVEEIRFAPTNQYEHQVATFARVIRGQMDNPWPISNAVAMMRALDAVRVSAHTGQRVTVPSLVSGSLLRADRGSGSDADNSALVHFPD